MFFLLLIWTRSYPSFTKISNPLHMQFQCGEEMYWIMQKNSIKENRLFITFLLPICHDGCQEIKRWVVPKCLRFSNPQPDNSSYSHTWSNRQRGKKAYVKKSILISFNLQCFNCLDCWVFLKDKKRVVKRGMHVSSSCLCYQDNTSTYEQSPKYDPHVMLYKIWRFGPLPICGYLG